MAITTTTTSTTESSEVPSQVTTNTLLGNLINKCCATNQSVPIPQFSTVNEALEVLADTSYGIKNGRSFELKYFMVGRRGAHYTGTDETEVPQLTANQHQPIDSNLFTGLPLIARPVSEPLEESLRQKYRLRTVATGVDGISYEFYWAKLINFGNYDPQLIKVHRDPNTGVETPTAYIPDSSNLFPEPINLDSENTVPVSNTYVNASAILDCSLDANDLEELKNVARIIYGDSSKAAINETAICYGIDVTSEANIGAGVVAYTEAMSVVAAHFVTERDARNANNNSTISLVFDHGASEPMLLHTTS